jgi:hypothetical protein
MNRDHPRPTGALRWAAGSRDDPAVAVPLAGASGWTGQRWPATSSSRTFSEPISISSARSLRITAFAIASRPIAIAPTAETASASGPMAEGP